MKIDTNNYVVLIISSPHAAEKYFIKTIKTITDNGDQDFCYAAIGPKCEDKIISMPSDETININAQYSLYLINAKCWKCSNGHLNCECMQNDEASNKIKSLIDSIKSNNKNIIVWTHTGDTIASEKIKELFGDKCDFFAFSHTEPNHEVEVLMENICTDNDFENRFSGFIEYSLLKKAKPHLIALYILCEGYLAAHDEGLSGWNDNLKNLLKIEGAKDKTEKKDWWKPALGDDLQGKEIESELNVVSECLEGFIGSNGPIRSDDYFQVNDENTPFVLKDEKIEDFNSIIKQVLESLKTIFKGQRSG